MTANSSRSRDRGKTKGAARLTNDDGLDTNNDEGWIIVDEMRDDGFKDKIEHVCEVSRDEHFMKTSS